MTVDLFGVETRTEGPCKSPATAHTPPSFTSSGGPRFARWVRLDVVPGSLASQLGLRSYMRSDRTADERRKSHDDFLASVYASPRYEPTVDDLLLGSRPLLDVGQLARKYMQAAPGDPLSSDSGPGHDLARLAALRRLIACYSQTACSSRSETACSSVESFPDPYLQRTVFQAQLNDRARVLAQTQAEFPQSGKFADVRYLRAVVRNRNVELYAVRSAMRKCGQRRHSRGGVIAYATPASGGGDRVTLSGIVRCGSVHSCPRCAPRISAQRAELLKKIVARHRDTGGGLYMVTLTVPHSAQMPIRTLRRAVAAAWKLVQQGKSWRALKERMRFVGSVAAREVTHGGNGWHPHLHILVCTRSPLSAREQASIRRALRERWQRAVARQDVTAIGQPSRRHGVKLTAQRDATYIEKLGLADELLGAVHKVGRDGNRTPFEIMADYARQKTARDAHILRPFHRGIKGARQLTWSRGKSSDRTCPRTQLEPDHRCGPEDLRCIYADVDATAEQLLLLAGDDDNATVLAAQDKAGRAIAAFPPQQWDAFARVMRAARGDAETELVLAIETHGLAGARAVMESAYRMGVELAQRRPRLKRWLWWLDPRRRYSAEACLSSALSAMESSGRAGETRRLSAKPAC